MSNILKPELIWVEGRCYRVNDPATEISTFQEHDLYEDESICKNEEEDDENDDFEVTMVDNSRFSTHLHVPKHYIGSIIGKKGATKMRLERETRTNIKIPRQTESGDIYILGSTVSHVKTARRRINLIVMASRAKQRPTHFISIPVNAEEIMKNFEIFKDQILKDMPSRGIEESIFIKAQKLHLTIGVMCLMDNEERIIAAKLLNEAKNNIVLPLLQSQSPMRIHVRGVEYMNDDPKQIDVLYARAYDENGSVLQTLADQLVDFFCKSGYMNDGRTRDHVKLHVTLINTRYRSAGDTDSHQQNRESFDGSDILKKYADFDFGVVELKEIHLSQRNTIGDDGYYQPTCIISCKTSS